MRGFQDKSEVSVNFSDFGTDIKEGFLILFRSHNAICKKINYQMMKDSYLTSPLVAPDANKLGWKKLRPSALTGPECILGTFITPSLNS